MALRLNIGEYQDLLAGRRSGSAAKPKPAKIKAKDFSFWPIKPGELVPIAEEEFQRWCEMVAGARGWTYYHTHDSRRSEGGFLDLHLARPPVYLVRELKVGTNGLSPEQRLWVSLHEKCGHDVAVWRPEDKARILAELD